jgi:hypothetical protein
MCLRCASADPDHILHPHYKQTKSTGVRIDIITTDEKESLHANDRIQVDLCQNARLGYQYTSISSREQQRQARKMWNVKAYRSLVLHPARTSQQLEKDLPIPLFPVIYNRRLLSVDLLDFLCLSHACASSMLRWRLLRYLSLCSRYSRSRRDGQACQSGNGFHTV